MKTLNGVSSDFFISWYSFKILPLKILKLIFFCFSLFVSANETNVEVNMESILEVGRENQTLSANSQDKIEEKSLKEDVAQFFNDANLDFAYEECLNSYRDDKYVAIVKADLNEAKVLGINSTPTFIVNGYVVSGGDGNALLKIVEAIEQSFE